MFADLARIIARGVAVAGIIAAVIVLFNVITIPTPTWGNIATSINQAYAVARHWAPALTTILPIGIQLITLELAIMGVELAGMAYRWILKVNE